MSAATPETARLPAFAAAKRLAIKIGSALLVDAESGHIRRHWLEALADDVAAARARGSQVFLVSSGAIAVGRRHLGLTRPRLRLEEKQAAAATGQIRLAHAYQEALGRHGISVAQVLLTLDDTEARRRHLNARATLNALLGLGAVPIINENDTVATSEIRYGDNDRLAARVAAMMNAEALILLSDIDGLYTADPRRDPEARHIPRLGQVSAETEAMAGSAPPGYSSGGMVTKLAAAKIALAGGCSMAIADGRAPHPLSRLLDGERCTWFEAGLAPLAARKRWIAGALKPRGSLSLDAGAVAALARGKSLLPAGVAAVAGRFARGDAVEILGPGGERLGRGLVAYDSEEAQRIKGHNSGEIERLLGYAGREELIHRDDMVLD